MSNIRTKNSKHSLNSSLCKILSLTVLEIAELNYKVSPTDAVAILVATLEEPFPPARGVTEARNAWRDFNTFRLKLGRDTAEVQTADISFAKSF